MKQLKYGSFISQNGAIHDPLLECEVSDIILNFLESTPLDLPRGDLQGASEAVAMNLIELIRQRIQ